jgi:hypothetical protein
MPQGDQPAYRVDPTGPAKQRMLELIAKAPAGSEKQ